MAVNKLDITMMEDVGTSANQLVQRDGSGNLPAIDGSQLTNVDPGFTQSTSDPTVSTNPSGGVGSVWYNKTSGEAYICTDATDYESFNKNPYILKNYLTFVIDPAMHLFHYYLVFFHLVHDYS